MSCRFVSAKAFYGGVDLVVQNGATLSRYSQQLQRRFTELGIGIEFGEATLEGEVDVDQHLQTDLVLLERDKIVDATVLIAGDGDHVNAVQVSQALGVPVVLLSWSLPETKNFEAVGVSHRLRQVAAHSLEMETVIRRRRSTEDPLIRDMFLATSLHPNRTIFDLGAEKEAA